MTLTAEDATSKRIRSYRQTQRCFYQIRALTRLNLTGTDAPDEEQKKRLRDCVFGCNGIDGCADSNVHNGHNDPNNPPPEGALPNFCNGYISMEDVEVGKCIRRIRAEGLKKRNEPVNGYAGCLECSRYCEDNHEQCYEDVREFLHIEAMFREYHGVRSLRL